jgi:hypothetical protein
MKGSGNFKDRRIEEKGKHDRVLKGKERIETTKEKKSLVKQGKQEISES